MKKAILYRMATPDHICPYGTRSKYLLEKEGYDVEDHLLKTRQDTDEFKLKHNVKTTPQTFIDDKRIGGYDDLTKFFGKRSPPQKGETSYLPVISLFGVSLLMALALNWLFTAQLSLLTTLHLFGGLSMCLLAVQKLRDLFSFTNSFLNYDLLALKYVPYSYAYPFLELLAGLGMLSGIVKPATAAIALFIGIEGAVSVFKAVYIDKRELKCACMGGDTNVPLGLVSFLENILMITMGIWTAFTAL